MRNEYNNVGEEYPVVTESQDPLENFGASDSEFFEKTSEYWKDGNEFWETEPADNTHAEKKIQEAKKRAQHKKLLKQMVYTVASVATVATLSRTIELPSDVQDVVADIVVTAEPLATEAPFVAPKETATPVPRQMADYTIIFTGNDELTREEVETELAKYNSSGKFQVVIEEGITGIGEKAFSGLQGLVQIEIADSVTMIGERAFSDCKNLVIDRLETANRTIGTSAFCDVTIAEVVISESYQASGFNPTVFYRTMISKVDFEQGITKIPDRALAGCDSIAELEIPDTVAVIGNHAFSECDGLTAIRLPVGMDELGESVFASCKNLQHVEMPENLMIIGGHAFSGCKNLVIDKLETANRTIGTSAFYDVTIKEVVISESYQASGFNPTVFYQAMIEKVSFESLIMKIPDRALAGCDSITEVEIPDTVTIIGAYAFSGCDGLTDIRIPSQVEELGENAFSGCENLLSVELPDSVKVIGGHAFSGCKNLVMDRLDTANRTIGTSAFYEVTIGEVVIGQYYQPTGFNPTVFYQTMIGKVSFEQGIVRIPDRALAGCDSITEVEIPDTVTDIGGHAFSGCDNLQRVVLPDSVAVIEEYAFKDCKNLKLDKLDTAMRVIGTHAFVEVTIDEVIISPTYMADGTDCTAFYMTNVGKVSFEAGITKIPEKALAGCDSITEVEIPDTVMVVGKDAFSRCQNVILVTRAGSAAEAYAIEEGIPYKLQ